MKIFIAGEDFQGKAKFQDERFEKLCEKFKSKKSNPLFVEFIQENPEKADVCAIKKEKIADFLIEDMAKVESSLDGCEDSVKKALLSKCLKILEDEIPLCDGDLSDDERKILADLNLNSLKPTVIFEGKPEINKLISECFRKAEYISFYTIKKDECSAWLVKQGTTARDAAGKIHTDLARGFIRAEIAAFEDLINCHSFNEAKEKNFVKTVDASYPVSDGDIIEIKFSPK